MVVGGISTTGVIPAFIQPFAQLHSWFNQTQAAFKSISAALRAMRFLIDPKTLKPLDSPAWLNCFPAKKKKARSKTAKRRNHQAVFGKLPCLQPKIKLAMFKQQIWTKLGRPLYSFPRAGGGQSWQRQWHARELFKTRLGSEMKQSHSRSYLRWAHDHVIPCDNRTTARKWVVGPQSTSTSRHRGRIPARPSVWIHNEMSAPRTTYANIWQLSSSVSFTSPENRKPPDS